MEAHLMDILQGHTIEEVASMEEHAQLIDGTLVIEDKTTVLHNDAVSQIALSLRNYISKNNGSCRVFTENVALYVNELCADDKNFFLPDVMVVCDNEGIKDDGVHTAPLFVVEVTSEKTRKNDYCEKLEIYRKIGVKEYWIVDIQRNLVYKYLSSEDFIPQTYVHPEELEVTVYSGLKIDLSSVMK